MLWLALVAIALAVGQVPAAAPYKHVDVDFIENVNRASGQGQDGSRIVSGWDGQPGQHPHHASLRMVDGGGSVFSCGGSLVSRRWVITAAHCTATRITIVVRLGVTHVINPQYIMDTTEWYNYPSFNNLQPGVVQPNDIGLVKLPRNVVYNNLVKAIRVQPRFQAFWNYDQVITYASGHGATWTSGFGVEVLQWVYLRAVSNTVCAGSFGTALINSNAICARFFNVTSQSTCQGDSGGPLVHVSEAGVPTLVGVASFVAGLPFGCHSGLPAGFIRPGPFHDWFTQITGLDFDNLNEEDDPPATEPPTTEPPATEPPATEPPATEPPATEPPATEPPATEPPTTEPPTTEPPTTELLTTLPAETEPPATQPPVTEPSVTDPPPTEKPDESEEDSDSDSDSESEEDDPELAELLKKLEVKVKVKVKMSKFGHSIKHEHSHNKTITRSRHRH